MCSLRVQYSGSILNIGKDCFQRRAKQCTLSCSQTDRCVWQTWFSEVLPSVPARGRHLYCKISHFPSVSWDANTHPDLPFFSYLFSSFPAYVFLLVHSPSVFVSFFQSFSPKKLIYSPFISLSCFFFHIPFLHMFFSLLSSATPFYIMPPLSALLPPTFPLLTLSFLSHLPSLPHSCSPRSWRGEMKSVCILWQCSVAAGGKTAVLWFYLWICRFLMLCISHMGAEGEWRAAWCELLLVPPVELLTSKEAEEVCTHAHTSTDFRPNMY